MAGAWDNFSLGLAGTWDSLTRVDDLAGLDIIPNSEAARAEFERQEGRPASVASGAEYGAALDSAQDGTLNPARVVEAGAAVVGEAATAVVGGTGRAVRAGLDALGPLVWVALGIVAVAAVGYAWGKIRPAAAVAARAAAGG